MGDAYDPNLRERAEETGRNRGIHIGEGTYLGASRLLEALLEDPGLEG